MKVCWRRIFFYYLLHAKALRAILGLTVQQLWPLDSQTCKKETLIATFSQVQVCDELRFGSQPTDFPFKSMVFNGTNYVDASVNFPASTKSHYSVQGFFYLTQKNRVLFNFKASKSVAEVILWVSNGILKMYRKVTNAVFDTYTGSKSLSLNRWYYLSCAVGEIGYVYVYIDGSEDIYGTLGQRSLIEVPGNLRIGADFDQLKTTFKGLIACVGFYWNTRTPDVTEIQNLCQTTQWMLM